MAQLKIQSHLLWQRSKWLTPLNKHARTWGRHDDCRLGVERSRTNTKSTPTDKYESIMYMCLCALSHSFPKLDNNGARGESRGLGRFRSGRFKSEKRCCYATQSVVQTVASPVSGILKRSASWVGLAVHCADACTERSKTDCLLRKTLQRNMCM